MQSGMQLLQQANYTYCGKMFVTFVPTLTLLCPSEFALLFSLCDIVYFMTGRAISNHLGMAALYSLRRKSVIQLHNELMAEVFIDQPLALPESANLVIFWNSGNGLSFIWALVHFHDL